MISGASEEELIEAIGRADVLLEFMPKIKQLKQENEKLKDNWNKLREFIRRNIIYDDVGMKILDTSPLEDYIQKLEQGSDSNGQ